MNLEQEEKLLKSFDEWLVKHFLAGQNFNKEELEWIHDNIKEIIYDWRDDLKERVDSSLKE